MWNRPSGARRLRLFPPLRVPFSPSQKAALLTLRRIRAENRFSVNIVAWAALSLFFITLNLALSASDGPPALGLSLGIGALVGLQGLRLYRGRAKYRSKLQAAIAAERTSVVEPLVDARLLETGAIESVDATTLRGRLLESAEQVRDALRPISPESLTAVSQGESRALELVSWLDDAERSIQDHRVERELRRAVATRLSESPLPEERAVQGHLMELLDRYEEQQGVIERRINLHRSQVESFLLALDNVRIAHAGKGDVIAAAAPLAERSAWLSQPAIGSTPGSTPAAGDAAPGAEHWQKELQMAQDLQRSILPSAAPEVAGLEVAHVYRPSNEVGGDFYDFYQTGEGRLLVALGDASGHGLDSSMISSMAKSALYMQISSRREAGPERLATALAEINRMVCDTLGRHRLMTLALVELDTVQRTVSWVNAGQVYPLVRRGGEVHELELPGYPLGVRRELTPRLQQHRLEPGDLLLLLTDGYFEAANPADEPFGWHRLLTTFAGSSAEAPGALLDDLSRELGSHLQGRPIQDDVTLIALGFQP
ncbi:MAG: PP2C family protein-serine/threonine phosphatase [Acidobacteriota bacterium]